MKVIAVGVVGSRRGKGVSFLRAGTIMGADAEPASNTLALAERSEASLIIREARVIRRSSLAG